MIIPVAEVAHEACKRPTQNDQPAGQPACGSKFVKTQSAECLPSFARTRMQTTIAMTPAIVQKIANCYKQKRVG